MKFSTTREALLEPLLRIYGVIENRRTLPILSNVLLSIKDNILSMIGTDMEMELITNLELIDSEDGDITVSARKFSDICRTLPPQAEISFVQEEKKAIIQSGNSRFVLGTLPAEEYPNSSTFVDGIHLSAKQGRIREIIELTQFAMANQDVRYWLNGLLLEISKGKLRVVATDGHRLALAELEVETNIEDVFQVIVPRKAIIELGKMLSAEEKEIKFCFSSKILQAEFLNTKINAKLIDGRYPDYNGVLPNLSQCDKSVLVERESLRKTLIRAAILCGEGYRVVRMFFDKNLLRISTRNMEREEAQDEIDIDYEGDPFEIGFNATYLLEVIGSIPTTEVRMYFKNVRDTCLVKPVGRDDCQYVVMPVKL